MPYLIKRINKILGDGAYETHVTLNIIQEDETYEQIKHKLILDY